MCSSVTPPGRTDSYAYNAWSGRLDTVTDAAGQQQKLEYALDGRVTVVSTDVNTNSTTNTATFVVASSGSRSFTYDLNGNTTDDGERTYEWDGANRLVKINYAEAENYTAFTYDGLGRRVRIEEVEAGSIVSDRRFVYDGLDMAEQRASDGTTVERRYYDQGVSIFDIPSSSFHSFYYTRDHLGSIRELIDDEETVRARYDYGLWGERTKLSGDLDSDFGFTGHFTHEATGLVLAIYRAYDSETGRWLSRVRLKVSWGRWRKLPTSFAATTQYLSIRSRKRANTARAIPDFLLLRGVTSTMLSAMRARILPLMVGAWLAFPGLQARASLTIESVEADRSLWPKEVTIRVEHEIPVIIGGKKVGSSKIPAGRAYPLKAVQSGSVQVDALGASVSFSVEETDLLDRAGKARDAREAQAAAAPAVALPANDDGTSPVPDSGEGAETPNVPEPRAEASSPAAPNAIAKKIAGDLVSLGDGRRPRRITDDSLESKKYIAVYFSAAWCGPCRQFTPKLVEWYGKRTQAERDKFEVIFMSRDRSPKEMEEYMKDDKMPWPALAYAKRDRSPLAKYRGRGIPCLVIVDGEGNVLSHSYEGDTYVGPSKVLRDLERLLSESS